MDRWACVSLAALPLQIVGRSKPEWRALPTVVVSEDKPQGKVLWVSSVALRAGVLPGQSYALALSLCSGLRACVVSEPEITRTLEELKSFLWTFSPQLEAGGEPGVFWLDASGLGKLFASLEAWSARLREQLFERGFRACVVVGFSRFGSYALARAQREPESCVLSSPQEEAQRVAHVPLACLDIEPEFRDVLSKLGVHDIAALLRLPATGVLTRFGPLAARLHALAAGQFAPLQAETWLPPLSERCLLDSAESDSTRLLFVIKRLLDTLLKQLVLRGEALASLGLRFVLDRKRGTRETEPLRPAVPTLDGAQLLDLVRLRLESLQLEDGAIEVEVTATGTPASAEQLRVFVDQAQSTRRDLAAGNRAIARLRAELGPAAVVRAVLCDGHLPEACFAWQPLEAMVEAAPVVETSLPPSAAVPAAARCEPVTQTLTRRPLVRRIFHRPEVLSAPARQLRDDGWLIRGPQYGAVTHTAGPYLLNGGWWLKEVQREYQFVLTRRGELLWVYQDRRRRRWFLQGQVQ